MKPMRARTIGPKFCHYPCYVQPKLNGVRALYQWRENTGCTWQSQDEKIWFPGVLAHLSRELFSIKDLLGALILDGELYRHGWRLQTINGAVAINRKEPREDTHKVCFHVFDVVDPKRKFSDRWLDLYNDSLNDQRYNLPHIKFVRTEYIHNHHMFIQQFHHWTAKGFEGIMLRPDGPYEFGEHFSERSQGLTQFRSEYLWKHKQWEDDEFVCVDVTQGEGKADIGIGALVLQAKPVDVGLGCHGDCGTFKVGTGLTDLDRIEFAANPPTGKRVKVRYLNLTADGIPFNPSFLAVIQ